MVTNNAVSIQIRMISKAVISFRLRKSKLAGLLKKSLLKSEMIKLKKFNGHENQSSIMMSPADELIALY